MVSRVPRALISGFILWHLWVRSSSLRDPVDLFGVKTTEVVLGNWGIIFVITSFVPPTLRVMV